jgi:carbon monoxide dehydrogenase subunit G
MHLEGETEIAAGRQRVWAALTDPHVVAECVPGEPAIEYLDDRNLRVTAEFGNGFLRAPVTIEIELTELSEPARVQATATAAVMASPVAASGSLDLEEVGPELTRACWSAEVTLGGMLSGFGGMVQAPIKKGVERTLECLKASLEGEGINAADEEAGGEAAEEAGPGAPR